MGVETVAGDSDTQIAIVCGAATPFEQRSERAGKVHFDEAVIPAATSHGEHLAMVIFALEGSLALEAQIVLGRERAAFDGQSHVLKVAA